MQDSTLTYNMGLRKRTQQSGRCVCVGVGGGNQAYSQLSTSHGHIIDCMFDSVVYAGVCVVSF